MTRWRCAVLPLLLAGVAVRAEPPPALPLDAAVRFALVNNPQLAVARQQRGLAAAGVVLARVYPYNPTYNGVVLAARGEDVTNRVFNEHYVTLPIEIRGQWRARRSVAAAGVNRTEWEIAAQELSTAVAVVRAYNTVQYRQQKLDILDETVRLNELVVNQGRQLVEGGRLRPAEVIVARTELDAARGQRGQGRAALTVARSDLRRQLGTVDDSFAVTGDLDRPAPPADADELVACGRQLRPDLQARCAAVAEADARLRLQIADRFGNPTVGPRFEYNESRDTLVGVAVSAPIPVFNTRQGEIAQRRADAARARAELCQTEVRIAQDVQAALARFAEARKWADEYPTEVLPNLRRARQEMEQLFGQAEQGVDVLRVIGVQRNLLRAADAYLDARFEVSQAVADLAAAVGDVAVAVGGCLPATGSAPVPAPPTIVMPAAKSSPWQRPLP
jgi:cobalt-zinc-cadmium efflux system outer membrane protein